MLLGFGKFGPLIAVSVCAAGLYGQTDAGELRLFVHDEAGAGIAAVIELANAPAKSRQSVQLANDGRYAFRNLAFGAYRLLVTKPGFAPVNEAIEIRSVVPQARDVTLSIQTIRTSVYVTESASLLDPGRTGSVHYVGSEDIERRATGPAGRDMIDLIAAEPGWTLEANGILHPRESEYDTQFVVNGFPAYDNRSPAFAPTAQADDVRSLKVYTSGIPAEFGQKLGGVVEVNTEHNTSPGFHGTAVAQGGSLQTLGGFFEGQYVAGRTALTASAAGFSTDHYLDPPTVANDTNHASNNAFTAALERDLSDADRLRVSMTRRETRFLVPNDLLQQSTGQRQDRVGADIEGTLYYQHVFSGELVGSVGGMVRDLTARLWSNPLATPIAAAQDRGYREGYLKGALAGHRGRHEWKTGVEGRFASVREQFGYRIVSYTLNDVAVFDPELPETYEFRGRSQDREQAFFAQDSMRLGSFTVNLGLRFDHYSLLTKETGWSPRASVSWYSKPLGLVLHAAYDRTFGTPPFESLLVSAAPATRFGTGFYLPLRPSRGNYYEGGLTKSLARRVRLEADYFRRDVRNFEDDDLLLNTGVSFPIAFDKAEVRGVEVKVEVPRWGPFSGFVSYANTIGTGRFPISGGLFLDEGARALLSSTEPFPISQDIRNTAHAWLRGQISRRVWAGWSAEYSSGLPVEDAGELPDQELLRAQYGADVVARVNFGRGRVRPSLSINASLGADLWRHERRSVTIQGDAINLTNRLNVINFAGLLSGTAVSPSRSFGLRLRTEF